MAALRRILLLSLLCCREAAWPVSGVDLTALSLEELMEVEITTASRRAERWSRAAAAVSTLSGDELRRAGVSSVPEALRRVPGLQVARFDGSKWAISSRGFNGLFANKLLVLVDGRSRYNTMYSGVFWETLDIPIEDVEQIEVIRGPGATLWGPNAVNGIVNIITRPADETQGARVRLAAGDEERGAILVRHGGRLGSRAHYRVYGHYFDRDGLADGAGRATPDGWDAGRAGFRLDWRPAADEAVTLQGDTYRGRIGETMVLADPQPPHQPRVLDVEAPFSGGFLLGRWERGAPSGRQVQAQAYYDRSRRDDAPLMTGYVDNLDLEVQQGRRWGAGHEVVWGGGYRRTWDDLDSDFGLLYSPARRTYHLASAFAQGDLAVRPHCLRLTLGSKFERNSFSGFEIQPNARLLWTPDERHTAWGAVSRAVRTPSRADHDIGYIRQVLPAGAAAPDMPAFVVASGTRDFGAEELVAAEAGYRVRVRPSVFADLSLFYNEYGGLRTYRIGQPYDADAPGPPHLVLPLYQVNGIDGHTWGGELTADWQPCPRGRLRAAYSYLRTQLHAAPGSQGGGAPEELERENPKHQVLVLPSVDLTTHLELDGALRYVGALEAESLDVGGYWELDGRLGWQATDRVELSLAGRNLLHGHHLEYRFPENPFVAREEERGVYGALSWSH
ncbi:MAG: TonB-dependent receptor [Gemmatimonadota bacterium]